MKTNTIDELIVRNLTSLMEEKALKPTRLAQDAGLSHTAITDIINRKSRSPSYATLVKIAEAAGVAVTRITVGLEDSGLTDEQREAVDLLFQLEPAERDFLLNAAKAQIASREQTPQQSPLDDQ